MANTDTPTFSSLVTGQRRFVIPPFQRGYAWGDDEVLQLWDDLIGSVEMARDHYIGTFLLLDQEGNETSDNDLFAVIDGQQRLTTLTILLFELQRALDQSGRGDKARMIRGEYIAKYGNQNLTLGGDDETFFRKTILENVLDDNELGRADISLDAVNTDSPSQDRLLEAKKKIRKRIETGVPDRLADQYSDPTEFYIDLYNKVQDLPLLRHSVDSRSEAARIFQTVNDRGKALTDLEITKSYLMHRVSLLTDEEQGSSLITSIQESFSNIYESVDEMAVSKSEDQIQRYHFIAHNTDWTSSRDKRYYQSHLQHLKDVFRKTADVDAMIDYVHELEDYYKRVAEISNYDSNKFLESDRVQQRLESLFLAGRLGNFYPLLLVAYDQYKNGEITESQLCRLLDHIESFVVRTYIIEQKNADTGRTRVYPLARSLYYNTVSDDPDGVTVRDIEEVIEKLADYTNRYCDDERLSATLSNAPIYDEYSGSNRLSELRLLLYAYEETLERRKEDIQFAPSDVVNNIKDRYSVEHIWPQTPGDEFDEETVEIVEEHTHRLGNLALMTPEDNSVMGNDPFDRKQRKFDGSKIRMLEEVFRDGNWGVEEIEAREQKLINAIRQRWPDTTNQ